MALSLFGAIVTGRGDDEAPPRAAEPPASHQAAGFFGISPQTELEEKDYELMKQGGVKVIRLGLSWDNVQSVPGHCQSDVQVDTCQWMDTDRLVGGAAVHGIRVLPALGGRPEFAQDADSQRFRREHPPITGEALEAWRSFVRAAADRYGHGGKFWNGFAEATGAEPQPIEEWQVWNEPNSAAYWPPEPDAGEYATLVRETATALREGDPKAEVVLGGMFGTSTISSRRFLRSLYESDGIEEYFDSLAMHPYSPDVDGVKVQARWLRKAAIAAGDSEVGLWISELGWSSGDGSHPLEAGKTGQAELLEQAFELLERRRDAWNIEGVSWFTWRDRLGGGVCQFCEQAGLFDTRGQAKPAWDVFKTYARGPAG